MFNTRSPSPDLIRSPSDLTRSPSSDLIRSPSDLTRSPSSDLFDPQIDILGERNMVIYRQAEEIKHLKKLISCYSKLNKELELRVSILETRNEELIH